MDLRILEFLGAFITKSILCYSRGYSSIIEQAEIFNKGVKKALLRSRILLQDEWNMKFTIAIYNNV